MSYGNLRDLTSETSEQLPQLCQDQNENYSARCLPGTKLANAGFLLHILLLCCSPFYWSWDPFFKLFSSRLRKSNSICQTCSQATLEVAGYIRNHNEEQKQKAAVTVNTTHHHCHPGRQGRFSVSGMQWTNSADKSQVHTSQCTNPVRRNEKDRAQIKQYVFNPNAQRGKKKAYSNSTEHACTFSYPPPPFFFYETDI